MISSRGYLGVVEGVMGESVFYKFRGGDQFQESVKNIEPISLTSNILEKCGFEETYSSKYKQSYDHKINGEFGVNLHSVDSMYDKEGRTLARYYSENIRTPIFYLHQLQNLYFALTGEELSVSL